MRETFWALFTGSLPVLVLPALCYAMAKQLAHPRGWVGRRLMARFLNEEDQGLLDAGVDTRWIRSGSAWGDAVDLHLADVARMPFADGSQDGVLSVNTLHFWPEPDAALRKIRRVLTPGGRLVLGVRSRGMMRLSADDGPLVPPPSPHPHPPHPSQQ
jgi:SAM-dependent methyltransferase